MTDIVLAPVTAIEPTTDTAAIAVQDVAVAAPVRRRTLEEDKATLRRAAASIMPGVAMVLAQDAAEAAIAPQRPYIEPKRLDVPASVVRELLQAAGLGTGCAKATLVLQPTYSTNAAALSWCEGSKDEVVVLTRAAGRWEAQALTVLSPWDGASWTGDIGANVAIVVYKHRGMKGWVEIVVAPDSAFLGGIELPTEAPAMSDAAGIVLRILDGLKASYRPNAYARQGINSAGLAAAIDELKRLGFVTVNRAGSVGLTMPGKNAARLLPRMLGL